MRSDPPMNSCPVCASHTVDIFLEIPRVPVLCNVLFRTRGEALDIPRGDLHLYFCQTCGHVYNAAFDPERIAYTHVYENSLHFSPQFRRYVAGIVNGLVERYGLREKIVIDVGCGQGDFLEALCTAGNNRGIGFDPSYRPDPRKEEERSYHIVPDYYSSKYAGYAADAVACRQVLEHIPEPASFMRSIRQAVDSRSSPVVFFEVPNALWTLRDMAIWDLIYEHCSYFSPASLEYVFRQAGFEVERIEETYGGQYLTIYACPSAVPATSIKPNDASVREVTAYVTGFADRYRAATGDAGELIDELLDEGKRPVIWGAGSKGIMLSNHLELGSRIPYYIDMNVHKHGMYVAGTGQRIMPPEFLREYQPDTIVLTNPLYMSEVRRLVKAQGIEAECILLTRIGKLV